MSQYLGVLGVLVVKQKTMKAIKKIDVQDWMVSSETGAVMGALNDDGQKAMFVGGCVRNALLGEEVGDIDIATIWSPQEATEKLETAGIKVVPTGIEHGTVTAVTGGKAFEITTLRKDVETDGRRAVVAFTDDWAQDSQRRDFTMNTLLADQAGNIYDPTGQGLVDLEARRVLFVGDAALRIAEDHLRILRFFRFHAMYGEGELDDAALKACRAAADKIAALSKERITQEFFKIMSVDNPVDILGTMFENGVLKDFSFVEYHPSILLELCKIQDKVNMAFLPSRLFVLAGLEKKNIETMKGFLLFPKVFLKDIEAVSKVMEQGLLDSDQALKKAVYQYGRTASAQALLIQTAQGHFEERFLGAPLELVIKWEVPNFPLSGENLIKAGYKPGPELGAKLAEIESWWMNEGFTATREECLERLD